MSQDEWSRKYFKANMFALDSASFYISARHLLLSTMFSGVKPGLVSGAYSLEYLLKAALIYKDIEPPTRGTAGHNLFHLANLLDSKIANQYKADLDLFYDYFNSRYFTHETERNGMYSDHVHKLDEVYRKIYEELNVPIEFHHSIGILGRVSLSGDTNDMRAFEDRNSQYEYYNDLHNKSIALIETH